MHEEAKPKIKFQVVESRWLRGHRSPLRPEFGLFAESRLRDSDGAQCCMGFLAEACGVPRDVQESAFYFSSRTFVPHDHLLPEELRPREVHIDGWHNERAHGELAQDIYTTNDDLQLSDDERKEKLKDLFAQANVEVEFVP